MAGIRLKRIVKRLDALQYTLIIYYHKDLTLPEIGKRVKKRHPSIAGLEDPTDKDGAVVYLDSDNNSSYVIINQDINIGQIHHEAIHVTTHAFHLTGSEHTEETDEMYAFHSQQVFEFMVSVVIEKLEIPIANLLEL